MTFFSAWFTVFMVSLVAVVTPGPDFAITLRNSLSYSRRSGLYTALGIGLGNIIHVTYCLIGLGAVISKSILLFTVLKWMGAGYLIYIGIKSLKAPKVARGAYGLNPQSPRARRDIRRSEAFRIGLLGNLLNPKATLFVVALFTQIVQPSTPIMVQAIYGMTLAAIALLWFVIVAILVSQPAFKQRILAVSHWFERVTGAVLVLLGLRLAIAEGHS